MNLTVSYVILVLFIGSASLQAAVAAASSEGTPRAAARLEAFGPDHRVWQSSSGMAGKAGKGQLIEVQTGMLYQENGGWQKSVEQIELREHHAVAYRGRHKVIFTPNINQFGAVYLIDGEGREYRSHVLGISYYDATNRTSVLLAEVRDSIGELVPPNQIVYKNAFTDIRADIRFTYTKAGLEQDVILHEMPPAPETFGMSSDSTRLEVLTEFIMSPPPRISARKLKVEKDPGRRAALAEPDIVDETLDFGGMVISLGKAFFTRGMEEKAPKSDPENGRGIRAGPPPGRKSVPVAKRWEKLSGRQFLIEAVEYAAIKGQVENLEEAKPIRKPVNARRVLPDLRGTAGLSSQDAIRVAQAAYQPKGLVLDYYLVHTTRDFTFETDETYYISGDVFLSGLTSIQNGAVLKFAPGSSLRVLGDFQSPNGNGKAYLTAANDHSLGVETPSRVDGPSEGPALAFQNLPDGALVRNLEIRHAGVGIEDYSPQASHVVDGCVFFKCGTALEAFGAAVELRNTRLQEVETPHRNLGGDAVVRTVNVITTRNQRSARPVRLLVNDDHGDSRGTASSLGVNSSVSGAIDHGGDEDYFRLDFSSGGTLTAYTSGSTDTYGYLEDANGNTLTSNDDNPYPNFSFSYSVSAGTYYIRVRHYYSGVGTGSYALNTSFSGSGGGGSDDHGNSTGSATSLSVGGSLSGAINYAGDEDYFRVSVGVSGTLTAYTTGGTDTYGYLLDAYGSTITSNDDNPFPNFRFSSSVSPGTYYVRIRHFSGGGTGSYTVYVELSGGPQLPPAPTGLSGNAVSQIAQTYISWSGSAEATSYNVKRSTGGGPFSTIGSTPSTGYIDFGVAHGTTYSYTVSAVNSAGESANAVPAIGLSTAPVAPTGLSGYAVNSYVYLGWNTTAGTYGYRVKRSTVSGGPYTLVGNPGSSTYFTDYSVSPGTTYYYVITASSSSGAESYPSSQITITTVPASPTGLSATPGNLQTLLSWSAAIGATSYKVKRSTTSGGPYVVIGPAISGTTYTDTGLSPGTYYYVVSASNSSGESGNSAQVSATIVASDSDGDGLPDTWEQQHFGNLSQSGSGDYDGDGFTNLQEYQAGSNPAAASPCLSPPGGLVSWWRAENATLDQQGVNHGALRNGAGYAVGMVGQCFSLDGLDDVIEVPNTSGLNFGSTTPITVEAWVYRTGAGSIMHVLGKRDGCGSINYQLAFDPSGGLQFNCFSGGVYSGVQLAMNQWTHLAGTFDGSTFRLFMNGALIGTGGGTLGPMNSAPLMIGGSGTCGYTFAGRIDELSLYNRALSASEIQSLYTAGRSGKCVPNADTDGDGLPDNWELQNFGSLSQNAAGDYDSDWVLNLQEFQSGTNPTIANVSIRIGRPRNGSNFP